ncbi:uncharacterized protein BXZ73DRAFT_2604, partial [Epithele typhae]|uniref:uncharacterized protein n=1 Tax=Epithele typhae TaxID=378194 RepID=UPI0020087F95
GCSGPFPWPRLERLVIACPNAQDEVYEHLPPTLRALSLRHWKFAWLHEGLVPSLYHSSGAMLAILRRCAAADIERLEIEYRADSTSEDAMLRFVAGGAFPRLERLTLLRYDEPYDEGDFPARIAAALAPMSSLRHLRVYFDFFQY